MSKFIRTPIYQQLSTTEFESMAQDPNQPQRDQQRDDLLTKVLKYVPVEVVAAFTAAVAFFSSQDSITDNSQQVYTLIALLVGIVATPLLFFYYAWTNDGVGAKPAWYFYLFSFVCFPVWVLVTSANAREAISPFSIGFFEWDGAVPLTSHKVDTISAGDAEIALFVAAVLIPAIDQGLTNVLARRKLKKAAAAKSMTVTEYQQSLKAAS